MIDPLHGLPVTRQAELLGISRSNVYYLPRATSDGDLAMMRRMDELHMNYPFAGSRMLRDMLRLEGFTVGRAHVATLMEKMGIAAIYRKRNTSKPHPDHPIYPYLLRGLKIDRPNQVWCVDLTYIPMARGFVYLVAIMDWATRRVLSHRLSISMTTDFCVEALEEAIAKYGAPEMFNSDQGSQFTSADFTGVLKQHSITQHGRQGPLGRQRVHRTSLAFREIRARLSACPRKRRSRPCRDLELSGILQLAPTALRAWRPNTGYGILHRTDDERSSMKPIGVTHRPSARG